MDDDCRCDKIKNRGIESEIASIERELVGGWYGRKDVYYRYLLEKLEMLKKKMKENEL